MPYSLLKNNDNMLSVQCVFDSIPRVFIPYLEKIKTDNKAILVLYLLYLHSTDEQKYLNTLQEMANQLSISRNTVTRIFDLLESIGLFERHYVVKNKYEGNSFNKKIVDELNLDVASGKHIFIFTTTYNDINDWLRVRTY